MQGRKFKNLFSRDRKMLYMVFSIVLIFVFSLTIVYAALNAILRINGNAEISASSWDIKLDNVQLLSGSATTNVPVITDKTTATFTTTLTNPGDYYMFTIDVVNNGTIDAMIDSIEKIPTLTEQQTKYLNYIVEYQNGESINTKQLVEANSFVRLKVKVEFRKDISSTDLPTTSETLKLSFKVNYVQADENNTSIVPNGGKLVKVVSGDGTQVGDEVCIDTECFYVISSTEETVTMLSKMNIALEDVPVQSVSASEVKFSSTNYWSGIVSGYPFYVYDSNSNIYNYVENYKTYLEKQGVILNEARLITYEELESLGCVSTNLSCSEAPSWVYSTTYWAGTAYSSIYIWRVRYDGAFDYFYYGLDIYFGVRPVITISKSEF